MPIDLQAAKADLGLLCEALGIEARRGAHKCPFHEDKRPSLSVFEKGGGWKWRCHGCGASGDAIDALARRNGSTPAEIIRAMKAGTLPDAAPLPAPSPKAKPAPPEPKRDLDAEGQRAVEARDDLSHDEAAQAYLWRKRGVSAHVAERFGVGCMDVRRDPSGRVTGATWTFQVCDPTGALVGVKLHNDPPRPGQPKARWLAKGGAGFFPDVKSLTLSPGDQVILCEGELKSLAWLSAGFPAVSPTTGASASWTPELAGQFEGLQVLVDPDREDSEAAARFAENAAKALRGVAREIKIAREA